MSIFAHAAGRGANVDEALTAALPLSGASAGCGGGEGGAGIAPEADDIAGLPDEEIRFARDSALEGAGFEPSVPRGHVEDAPGISASEINSRRACRPFLRSVSESVACRATS